MNNLYDRTWDEKRDFIRMRVDTEVTLAVDNSDIKVNGYCRDLSGTGMLIEVEEELTAGSTCRTTLPSTNEALPALDAKVKVIRCTRIDETTYQIGTEILEIAS
jgi:hypothetical protein